MAKRRGSGEGSIYQRQDGRWCAQVSFGYKPGGKPRRKLLYGKTRSEVSDAMKRLSRDQHAAYPLPRIGKLSPIFLRTGWKTR